MSAHLRGMIDKAKHEAERQSCAIAVVQELDRLWLWRHRWVINALNKEQHNVRHHHAPVFNDLKIVFVAIPK